MLVNLAAGVEAALDLGTHDIFAGVAGFLLAALEVTFILDAHLLGEHARERQAGLSRVLRARPCQKLGYACPVELFLSSGRLLGSPILLQLVRDSLPRSS